VDDCDDASHCTSIQQPEVVLPDRAVMDAALRGPRPSCTKATASVSYALGVAPPRPLNDGGAAMSRTQSHAQELERSYADGENIVAEGDHTRDMFVIQSGRVRITKKVGEREIELATLERGDFFGEMSLLESLPRDATARAVGETRLLVISAGALLVRMRRDPTFAFEMLHRLSGRVRVLNAKLVGLLDGRSDQLLYLPEEARAEQR
jgi:CRP-like cAMP-binding protein